MDRSIDRRECLVVRPPPSDPWASGVERSVLANKPYTYFTESLRAGHAAPDSTCVRHESPVYDIGRHYSR